MADIGAITLRMAADTGGLRTDMDKAKQVVSDATTQMAQSTGKATAATNDYTLSAKQAREAALAQAAAQSELIDKLQSMAATAGKSRVELMQMQAATLGMTDAAAPYIAAIEKATAKTHELSFANAGVTRELSVLGREAANGNWSRFSGSLSVLASRTGLLEMAFSATGLAIAGVVAVIGVFAVAVFKGAQESEKLNNSLILTGNYAGITAGQFNDMAASIAHAADAGIGKGREALQDLVSSGKFTGEALDILSKDMVRMADLSGEKLSAIAKDYAKMPEGVAKWAEKHNESMHFMDVAQYEHIRALEETGRAQEAMITVGKLLDEHMNGQRANLGALETAWRSLKNAASGAWDAMLNLGRQSTADDKITNATGVVDNARSNLQAAQDNGFDPGIIAKRQAALETALQNQSVAQDTAMEQRRQATHTAEMARINEEGIAASGWAKKQLEHFDKRIGMQDALTKAQTNFDALAASGHALTIDQQQKIVEGIQKQYTEKEKHAKVVQDYYATLLAGINAYGAAAQQELEKGAKLTESDKFRNVEIEKMVGLYEKKKITFAQLLDLEAAMEAAAVKREAADDMEAQTKLIAEQDKAIQHWMDTDKTSLRQLDQRISKQEQSNAQIGMTKAQIDALKASQDEANAAGEETYAQALRNAAVYAGPYHDAYIQAANDADLLAKRLRQLSADESSGGLAQAAADAAKKAEQAWAHSEKTIEDGLYNAISTGGGNAFKKLLQDVKGWFARLVLSPIIQPIGQFGASMMNPGAAGAAGSLGGLGGLGSLFSGGGGGFAGGAGDTMRNFGSMDSFANIGTLASGGSMMGALGAAMPYIGVALAVASLLSDKGHGPKTESSFATSSDIYLGSLGKDNPGQAQGLSTSIKGAYATLQKQLGLSGPGIDVGTMVGLDPNGTSQTQLQVAASMNGQNIYNRAGRLGGGIENVGRDPAALQAAVAEETTRVMFAALKGSDLPAQYKAWLNAVAADAGDSDMKAVINRITKAKTEQATLEETLYQMTHTDLEKLTRTRERELAAIDPSNEALLRQVYAQQDLAVATAKTTAIAKEAAGLQRQIYQLTGDTAAIRQLELAALDPANRALLLRIYALKDEADASALATQKAQQAAQALTQAQDAALAGVNRAIAAEQQLATAREQAASQQISMLQGLMAVLQSNINQLYGTSSGTAAQGAAQGRAFISNALSTARSTGYMPDQAQLGQAITDARGGLATGNFATAKDQQFAQLVLAGQLKGLQEIAGPQLTAAEQQLKAAQDQIEELGRIASSAQDQLDALRGIDKSVLSVADAILRFQQALGVGKAAGGVAASGAAAASGPFVVGASAAIEKTASANGMLGVQGSQLDLNKIFQEHGSDPAFIAALLQRYGKTQGEAAVALGLDVGYVNHYFDNAGIPRFAIGTNFVPRDMLAQIHEGEAIVPRAYNPAAGGQAPADEKMTQRIEALIQVCTQVVINTRRSSDIQQQWNTEGIPQARTYANT